MAKTCEVCKQSYPDELPSCPHCAAVKTMKADDLSMMAEMLGLSVPPPQPLQVDPPSDVGMGKPTQPPRPVSSNDINQMAAWLFNQGQGPRPFVPPPPPTPEPPPYAAFFDSGEHTPPPAGPRAVDLAFEALGKFSTDSSSEVDLGRSVRVPSSKKPTDSSSEVDLGKIVRATMPPAVPGVEPQPLPNAEDSGIIHAKQVPVRPEWISTESDELDLGATTGKKKGPDQEAPESSIILAEPVSESELPPTPEAPPAPVSTDSDHDIVAEPVSSEVDFVPPADHDLVGEPVSSEVELGMQEEPPSLPGDSWSEAPEPAATDPGSSVDLGGTTVAEPSTANEAGPRRRAPASSEIDLTVPDDVDLQQLMGGSDFDMPAPQPAAPAAQHEEEQLSEAPTEREELEEFESLPELAPEADEAYEQAFAEDEGEGEMALAGTEASTATAIRPAPPRPRRGGWLGGTVLGLLLGVGGSFGLWMAGIEPPAALRGKSDKGTQPNAKQEPVIPTPNAKPTTVADAGALAQSGEIDKALDIVQQTPGENPEKTALRGELNWIKYLQQRDRKAPPQAEDEPVKKTIEDLTKADTLDSLFWLGHIYSTLKQPAKAREAWTKGLDRAKDEAQKRRFQAALFRLDVQDEKSGGMVLAPWDAQPEQEAVLLALALIALQGQPQPADAESEEAGFKFWEAVKLAKQQDYGKALAALKEARSLHDQRRFTRLRKSQNPLTDPTEEIFLRACDELTAYWQMQAKLQSAGYLDVAMKKDPVKAVDELVQKVKTVDDIVAAARKAEMEAKAQATEALQQRNAAKADLAKAEEALTKAKADTKTAAGKLAAAEDRVKSATQEATKSNQAFKAVKDPLVKAKLIDDKADERAVAQSVENLIKANSASANLLQQVQTAQAEARTAKDKQTAAEAAVKAMEDKLKKAEDNARVLQTNLAAAQQEAKTAKDKLQAAETEVSKAKDSLKSAETRVKTLTDTVKDLTNTVAARDAELKKVREELSKVPSGTAVAELTKKLQAAETQAKDADSKLKEAESKLTKAEAEANKAKDALKSADAKVKSLTDTLVAREAELKKAQDELKKAPSGTAVAELTKKLQEAEGKFKDTQTRLTKAEAEAKAALDKQRQTEAEARAARERLTLAEARIKDATDAATLSKTALERLKSLLITAKMVDAGSNQAALEQAIKNLITRAATNGGTTVKVPVVPSTPNLQDADKHYAVGLSRYFSRRYADAEAEFLRAIANDSQDARFYYFLGLARFLQGKPASEEFAQGAALEQQDRPGQEAVSRALERVQGPERLIVNESRKRLR